METCKAAFWFFINVVITQKNEFLKATANNSGLFYVHGWTDIRQRARDGDSVMYRMYGMSQGARDGGVTMYRMYGMSQGARDGGVTMHRDMRYTAKIQSIEKLM